MINLQKNRLLGTARRRSFVAGSLSSVVAKIAAFGLSILVVKIALPHLGNEQFGLYMAVLSVLAFINLSDVGIGSSLVSIIGAAKGRNEPKTIENCISTAFWFFCGLSLVLSLLTILIVPQINWGELFSVKTAHEAREVQLCIAIILIAFSISLPFSIVYKVQLALQHSHQANLWQAGGSCLAILGLLAAIEMNSGIAGFVLAATLGPSLTIVIAYSAYFHVQCIHLTPKLRLWDYLIFRRIMSTSGFFIVLQAMALLGNGLDNLIIAKFLGLSQVTEYSVIQRLVNVLGIGQLIVAPMWPIFGEALGQGEYNWARKVFRNILIISASMGFISGVVLLLFGRQLISLWTSSMVTPDTWVVWGFAFQSVLMSVGGVVGSYLNNEEYIRKQVALYSAASLLSVVSKIVLVSATGNSAGAVWATFLAYSFFFIVPSLYIIYKKKI